MRCVFDFKLCNQFIVKLFVASKTHMYCAVECRTRSQILVTLVPFKEFSSNTITAYIIQRPVRENSPLPASHYLIEPLMVLKKGI